MKREREGEKIEREGRDRREIEAGEQRENVGRV